MDDWPLGYIKRTIVGERRTANNGSDITYLVYRWDDPSPDPIGVNDREGAIYVSESVVKSDERRADLTALHEQVELQHKARGRSHAYAHRRAFVEELLAAKQLLGLAPEVQCYIQWKIEQYPPWKVFDRAGAIARLSHLLTSAAPRKGDILRVITDYPL